MSIEMRAFAAGLADEAADRAGTLNSSLTSLLHCLHCCCWNDKSTAVADMRVVAAVVEMDHLVLLLSWKAQQASLESSVKLVLQ